MTNLPTRQSRQIDNPSSPEVVESESEEDGYDVEAAPAVSVSVEFPSFRKKIPRQVDSGSFQTQLLLTQANLFKSVIHHTKKNACTHEWLSRRY